MNIFVFSLYQFNFFFRKQNKLLNKFIKNLKSLDRIFQRKIIIEKEGFEGFPPRRSTL